MATTNAEIGQRIQEKFQFYMLGLIFTLLGLAIQTATFGSSVVADILELVSWCCLLAAALLLASRLEWTPQIYHLFDMQEDIEETQKDLKNAQAIGTKTVTVRQTGEVKEINDVLSRLDERLAISKQKINELDKGAELKYKIYRYAFIYGLVILLLARAYIPIASLAEKIPCCA